MKLISPSPMKETQHSCWLLLAILIVFTISGDFFGYILAWLSLLPIFMIVSFLTLVVFRRDLHTICYGLGLLANEICNWILKHIIKEPRPSRGREVLHTLYGMPSAHSQFMWFFSSYLVLFLFVRVHHNYRVLDNVWKYLVCLGSFSVSGLISYGRIYLGYHSVSQVFWGALVGFALGLLWFGLVQFVFTPFFPVVASWPISEFLMIRDSTLIPNVLWFEYTCHRSEARSRQRKRTARKSQ